MPRIFLPLAIVAAMFFGPMFSETTTGSATGETVTSRSGEYFIGEAIACIRELKAPIGEECASTGELNDSTRTGSIMSWAAVIAIAAAALGVPGLLPVVGRLISFATLAAGIAAMGAIGLLALEMIGSPEGLPGLQWGAYLTAAAGLLTVISGLSGIRGN